MLASGTRTEGEIFERACGDRQGREYWGTQLSEPIRVYSLAHTLAVHVAEGAEQLNIVRILILRSFRDAAAAGERWFIGDTRPLLAVENDQTDFANLIELKVHPRAAVEWLLSKPKRKHLVPDSLRTFLQLGGVPVAARVPLTEREAERFVARFINDEIAAGRRPTLTRVEAAARRKGMRGGRDYIRAAFHQRMDVRRGRPPRT
jgi:hypothetical protein